MNTLRVNSKCGGLLCFLLSIFYLLNLIKLQLGMPRLIYKTYIFISIT